MIYKYGCFFVLEFIKFLKSVEIFVVLNFEILKKFCKCKGCESGK